MHYLEVFFSLLGGNCDLFVIMVEFHGLKFAGLPTSKEVL